MVLIILAVFIQQIYASYWSNNSVIVCWNLFFFLKPFFKEIVFFSCTVTTFSRTDEYFFPTILLKVGTFYISHPYNSLTVTWPIDFSCCSCWMFSRDMIFWDLVNFFAILYRRFIRFGELWLCSLRYRGFIRWKPFLNIDLIKRLYIEDVLDISG